MLHILFLILKIIGIILLVILGIALVLVGTVLFVPVRYRLKTETTHGLKGLRLEAKATWLFHLMSAHVTYQDDKLDWQARIAWKKLNVDEKESKRKETSQEIEFQVPSREEIKQEKKPLEETKPKEEKETKSEKEPKTEKKPKEKENWLEKIKCTIQEFCDKIKNIKEFLVDEIHLQAFMFLKNELIVFIKRIKPYKVKGYLRFGMEDPYNTGRILAVLSVLYPFYGENVEIYPEFDKEILEADVFFKGRIHLIHLLIIICKIYFDNNVKVAYKNLKALKE